MERASEWFIMLMLGLAATVVLGSIGIGIVALCHHHIEYWAAYLTAGLLVFFGEFFLDSDWVT